MEIQRNLLQPKASRDARQTSVVAGSLTCLLRMKGEQRSCEFVMNTEMMNGQKLDDRIGIFLKLH